MVMLIRIMIKMMIRMMIFVMTINIRKHIKELFLSFPFANVFSMADGPLGESSGTVSTIIIVIIITIVFVIVMLFLFQIYMYTTPIEISFIDLAVDDRASITLSLAQVIIFTVTIVINIVIIMLNAHGTHLSELNQLPGRVL